MNKFRTTSLIIMISLTILFSCKREDKYILFVKADIMQSGKNPNYSDYTGKAGIDIKVYGSELDYKLKRNPLFEGITVNTGEYMVEVPEGKTYWISARKDSLNELRFGNVTTNTSGFYEASKRKYEGRKLILISTTPVRLELQLLNADTNNITYAQIYLSEEDFLNDVRPPIKNEIIYLESRKKGTNSIIFPNLESKEYWLKVSNGNKSNLKTVFKTNGKLEDNAEITNVLTVPIE